MSSHFYNDQSYDIYLEQFIKSKGNYKMVLNRWVKANSDVEMQSFSEYWLKIYTPRKEQFALTIPKGSTLVECSEISFRDTTGHPYAAGAKAFRVRILELLKGKKGLETHVDYHYEPPSEEP